jgi:hypothetical protein
MHYNSVEHFLTENEAAFAHIIEEVQRGVGGHYARLTPAELHATAVHDAHLVVQSLMSEHIDRHEVQESARDNDAAGIELDDLIRFSTEMEARLIAYAERDLHDQPNLAAEVATRLRHRAASYRSNVTAVKLEASLKRLKKATGPLSPDTPPF